MAISYVGQAVQSASPTADTVITLPTGVPMVAGDLIIIAAVVADTANNALIAPTEGGYTSVIGSTIYSDDVNDVNLDVFWRYYTGAQTTATFADNGGSNASNIAVCMVFRDVATAANGGPFNATAVQASGNGTSNADPAQIATATGDAVVIVGASGHTGGATATYTNPANYTTNPAVRAHNDTIDGLVGMGYRLSGYANPENPGAFTAATIGTAADNAWAAVTMALKANNASVTGASPTALATVKFAPVLKFIVNCAAPTALATTKYAPTVTAIASVLATPTTKALTTTKYAPTIGYKITAAGDAYTIVGSESTSSVTAVPPIRALALTTYAPTIDIPLTALVIPGTLNLLLSTFASTITIPQRVTPTTLGLTTTTFAPTIDDGSGPPPVNTPYTLAMMGYGR